MTTVAERLRAISPGRGGGPELSRLTGIPKQTIQNWMNGRGEPDVTDAVKIARAAGVSLEWLATGEGEMRPSIRPLPSVETQGIDEALLVSAVRAVELEMAAMDIQLSPEAKGKVIAAVYDFAAASAARTVDRGTVRRVLRLVA